MRFALCLGLAASVAVGGCTLEEVQPAPDGSSAQALPDDAPRADGRTDAEAEALDAGARGSDVVTAESPDEAAPLADGATYRLRRLVMGDAACYVDLQADGGETETRLADFGVCSQAEVEDLVGQPVRLELGTGRVMAASCQGDPECTEMETVELITRLYATG